MSRVVLSEVLRAGQTSMGQMIMEPIVYGIASIATLLVVVVILRKRLLGGHRVTLRLDPCAEASAADGPAQKGLEVELCNQGLPLQGVRVELYVRHSFGETSLPGMHGCSMMPVGTVPPELKSGETARFRLAEKDLEQPALLMTPDVSFSRYYIRELKDGEVAVLVFQSGGQLVKHAIFKAAISPEVVRRGQEASSHPQQPAAALPKRR